MTRGGTGGGAGPEKLRPADNADVRKPNPTRPPREKVDDDRPSAGDVANAAGGRTG